MCGSPVLPLLLIHVLLFWPCGVLFPRLSSSPALGLLGDENGLRRTENRAFNTQACQQMFASMRDLLELKFTHHNSFN